MHAKNHDPDQRDEKVTCLSSNFRDKQTDILTQSGDVHNQIGCPLAYWIKGRLYAKNQGPSSRDTKDISHFKKL